MEKSAQQPRLVWLHLSPRSVLTAIAIVIVAIVAYQMGSRPASDNVQVAKEEAAHWTCSMHPQVKLPKPGQCPICFMDLIPLKADQDDGRPNALRMTTTAVALARIETTPARREFATSEIRMVGKVDYDETRVANITAWIPGRIERLYIDYTGVTVRQDDHLFDIYSPDLVIAQEELLQAVGDQRRSPERESYRRRVELTEKKLELWGLLPRQIEEIKQRGVAEDDVTIYAPASGIVIHKHVKQGMYVKTGEEVYTIADLGQVWIFLDAYESDLPWLRYGQHVKFTTESFPGEIFEGRIAFIDPMLNENTRTVKIRVNVSNKDQRLKPGMFVRAIVKSRMAQGGQVVDEGIAGKWVSPHHPEILRDGPGKCPICSVDLVPAEQLGFVRADSGAVPPLVIPASAPLITGKRAVVYVKLPDTEQPTFEGREVLLGSRAGDQYIVRHGIAEGEAVVTRGNFKIDSALQISAKPSMMSPQGVAPSSGDGDHATSRGSTHSGHAHTIEVPAVFRRQITPLYDAYLAAGAALAADDLAAARKALQEISPAVRATKIDALDEFARGRWKTLSDAIVISAAEAADAADRNASRERFQVLSDAMTGLAQAFGHALTGPLYQVHCPMAFNNVGGDWLQLESEIRNPYFGSDMLHCGSTMATSHPQGPVAIPNAFRADLQILMDGYVRLQTALAADDQSASRQAAVMLGDTIDRIVAGDLEPQAQQIWSIAHAQLREALSGDLNKLSLDQIRQRFQSISMTFIAMIDGFDALPAASLFKVYCPMAFEYEGAFWLQADEQIANPYFGAEMLRCGTIKRRYVSQDVGQQEDQR